MPFCPKPLPDYLRGRTPDAILVPTGWSPPVSRDSRADASFDFFEAVLAVPRGGAWVMDVGDGSTKLVAKRPIESLLFPDGHPFAKFPQFDWYPQPDGGLQFGYRKEEAA